MCSSVARPSWKSCPMRSRRPAGPIPESSGSRARPASARPRSFDVSCPISSMSPCFRPAARSPRSRSTTGWRCSSWRTPLRRCSWTALEEQLRKRAPASAFAVGADLLGAIGAAQDRRPGGDRSRRRALDRPALGRRLLFALRRLHGDRALVLIASRPEGLEPPRPELEPAARRPRPRAPDHAGRPECVPRGRACRVAGRRTPVRGRRRAARRAHQRASAVRQGAAVRAPHRAPQPASTASSPRRIRSRRPWSRA